MELLKSQLDINESDIDDNVEIIPDSNITDETKDKLLRLVFGDPIVDNIPMTKVIPKNKNIINKKNGVICILVVLFIIIMITPMIDEQIAKIIPNPLSRIMFKLICLFIFILGLNKLME